MVQNNICFFALSKCFIAPTGNGDNLPVNKRCTENGQQTVYPVSGHGSDPSLNKKSVVTKRSISDQPPNVDGNINTVFVKIIFPIPVPVLVSLISAIEKIVGKKKMERVTYNILKNSIIASNVTAVEAEEILFISGFEEYIESIEIVDGVI